LVNYPRAERTFIVAIEEDDEVTSTWIARDIAGKEYKPADYLKVFREFIRENPAHVQAIQILLNRPQDWRATALNELREKLAQSRYLFTEDTLRRAHRLHYGKALVDIISMVKHAADEKASLLTAEERVEHAFGQVVTLVEPTKDQALWLDRIKIVMIANLSIDREDFDLQRALAGPGGWGAASRVFGADRLRSLIHDLNEAIAA
jgi:type I restriction enzyme R subunit